MDNFESFTIQTYDDQKERYDRRLAHIFKYDSKRIRELNNRGASICFVPNSQINPSIRSISNTSALKYISLDLDVAKIKDRLSKEEIIKRKSELLSKIKSLEIQPKFIIETKHGYQPLWELAKTIPLNSIEEREKMNEHYKSIIAGFSIKTGLKSEGDSISRVLRLPETYHMKAPNDPFLIKIFNLNPNKITLEEFEKVYPPLNKENSYLLQKQNYNSNPTIKKIISYPVQEVLNKLSGRKEVDFEKFDFKPNSDGTIQIVINGKVTGQWIDTKNNCIGGPGKGQGNPTIIQFVQWYDINRRCEDEKIAKGKTIKALKQILEIYDDKTEYRYKNNENVNVNNNDSYKQGACFELTKSKRKVLEEIMECNYLTPPIKVASLLTNFFKEWPSFEGHWLYIAQKYNPRAIWRTINKMLKVHKNGQITITNPPGYFTKIIKKYRKPRRNI